MTATGMSIVYKSKTVHRLKERTRIFFADTACQVDLSDDDVVIALFGDGKWENSLEQLYKQNGDVVVMTTDTFTQIT